ncbi:hypothetical protein [Candidatus Neptunochlamydia vexilliferae]|uniref:Helix-turn-helix type 11 domain-containing protein n=1 Tax=Candidatus Neptunichlamydia vexilliferae TaxID=1651774 RepID=A0ABS0AYH0_9BACT|nr:hypothetical protein [Candidatus Neptunochlamydia vexilliferae]MBF5059178.1 hypothetical protein [Candidatus Neptunochlamydia vexilliferae]
MLLKEVIKNLELYLSQALGVQTKASPWKGKGDLPLFLLNSYDFYEILLFDRPCLLIIPKQETTVSPATLKKHRDQVQTKWVGCCIYVQEAISPYNRQRLIRHRISFIAPGNQMYLPGLGIDLREYFQQPKPKKDLFSPATQAVVIYGLCHNPCEGYTTTELIKELGYSRMTLNRAFSELEKAGVGLIDRKGKERRWSFREEKRELWTQTEPLLRSPVKQRVWVKGKKPKIKAGLTALAECSMLNPPTVPIYAMSMADWLHWKESGVKVLPISEEATAELEIWHYNPTSITHNSVIDPFSLYLSLREIKDERIEAALESVIKLSLKK